MSEGNIERSRTKNRPIALILIQLLLVIALVLFLVARSKGISIFLFWPIIWSIMILLILGSRLKENHRIVLLILAELAVILIPIVSQPSIYQFGKDGIFESQYASIISREGRWDPSWGTGFAENYYGHNPVLHFTLGFSSLVTGLNTFFLSKYVYTIILRIVLLLSGYLLISTVIDRKHRTLIHLATVIFLSSLIIMPFGMSRRLIASIFFLLTIFTMFKNLDTSKKGWLALFYAFSGLIVLSDHAHSYLFLIFIGCALLISTITKSYVFGRSSPLRRFRMDIPELLPKFFFYLGIFIMWSVLISEIFLQGDLSYMIEVVTTVFTGKSVASILGGGLDTPSSVHINHPYENLIIYASQIVLIFLGVMGLLLYLRYSGSRREERVNIVKKSSRGLFLYLGIFGMVMYVLSGFLMRTSLNVVPQTFMWFFSISPSIFAAYSLVFIRERIRIKAFSSFITLSVIILIFTGSLLLGYSPTLVNRPPGESNVVEFVGSKTQQLYDSGLWLRDNSGGRKTALGDNSVFDVYSGFFEIEVVNEGYARELYLMGNPDDITDYVGGGIHLRLLCAHHQEP